jgi:hypothetical protein
LAIARPGPLIGWAGVHIVEEEVWGIRVVDSAARGRCIKQFVRSAKKSARFLSSLEKIVRYTARIVFQSARTKAANKEIIIGASSRYFREGPRFSFVRPYLAENNF